MTATPPPGAQGPGQGSQNPPVQQPSGDQQGWPSAPPQQQWPPQQPPQQQPPQQQPPQGWQQGAPAQHQYVQQPATGAYGYQYGPMPQYPTPQFPQQPKPQSGLPRWMWAVVAVLVVAVVLVFALPSVLDRGVDPGPSADPTDPTDPVTTEVPDDGFGQDNTSDSGTFVGEHMFDGMNAAITSQDKAAFLRFAEGEALTKLTLWWDNMEVLQWTTGAISPAPGQLDVYEDNTITLRVTLGGASAGAPVIPVGGDHPDAGLTYAPSNLYVATIRVTDDGASGVISGWEVLGTAAPWDLQPLYAVVTEHAVTAGYADEKDLVDEFAPLGEQGAAWVVNRFQEATGTANAEQFTMFLSMDKARFNEWFISNTDGWVGDRAGTMFQQRRPYPYDSIDASVAVGGPRSNAGGVLTVGPNGLLYGHQEALATIVHEFVHAMHFTNVPESAHPGSPATEGWATYNESLFMGQGEYARPGTYVRRTIARCVAENHFNGQFPVQENFTPVETVHCAYNLSSTMYAYAESLGVDIYEAADRCLEDGTLLPESVQAMGGPVLDPDEWWAWVSQNYGS